jgi:hypothetical protein
MDTAADTTQSSAPLWVRDKLKTNGKAQKTFRFSHPKRNEKFPILHCLKKPHPLRPTNFTAANYPHSGRERFIDYVLPIYKNKEFMTAWRAVGEGTATPPADEITSNEEQGMHLLPAVLQSADLMRGQLRVATT